MTTIRQRHYETLVQGLKQAGVKLTPQRLAILELLAGIQTHPTVTTIYQQFQPRFPTMSQTTVNNTLQTLVGLGLSHELGQAGDDAAHCDPDTAPHLNVICQVCGKIVDFNEADVVPSLLDAADRQSGFAIQGARIVYDGLCPVCRRKAGARHS